jgi:ATP synthase protein I
VSGRIPDHPEPRVLNSMAAGRRLARHILAMQLAVIVVVALVLLVFGWRYALGAALGGVAVAAGGALMAWRTFAGAVAGPVPTFGRLAGGVALKWLVIVLVLYIALARLALDPLAVLGGVLAALAVNLLALTFKS